MGSAGPRRASGRPGAARGLGCPCCHEHSWARSIACSPVVRTWARASAIRAQTVASELVDAPAAEQQAAVAVRTPPAPCYNMLPPPPLCRASKWRPPTHMARRSILTCSPHRKPSMPRTLGPLLLPASPAEPPMHQHSTAPALSSACHGLPPVWVWNTVLHPAATQIATE